jgi:hypothetical protein
MLVPGAFVMIGVFVFWCDVTAQDLMPPYAGDGEKHEGHAAIWNFCCRPDRVCGHRLSGDAGSEKDAITRAGE